MLKVTTPHTVRRLIVAAGASLAALGSLSAAPAATAFAVPSPKLPPPLTGSDRSAGEHHLTVTVRNAGGGADGTFELDCHPSGGSHPDPAGACRVLDRSTRWGSDTFAPVSGGAVCTMQYGGPATAHVTGTWAGRPVDTTFDRSNGCEIDRWDRLVPLLPDLRDWTGQRGAVDEARRKPGPL
ncbi:SSI family serine proteinase inhibitor [Streptomyces sp.]|uniref:SSI family serine proteinase inhibitor n=1 Tax=Streptomyces sp. TaxID=1931 RepID=UPI002D3026D7|nr:SSI family serine proteinase inhibitor [Streptomyces sp.]HZF89844.1 SSI family serine proteinase inhibitor [Streptomyces sp.]